MPPLKNHIAFALSIILIFLSGCVAMLPPPEPSYQVSYGDRILYEDFGGEARGWKVYDQEGISVQVKDGEYDMQFDRENYVWGQQAGIHTDVIVQATARLLSEYDKVGYGVMCRASPQNNGNGYYFMVTDDGRYSIMKGLYGNEVQAMIPWGESGAIKKGQAENIIQGVCIGDYLAMLVNGEFLAEVRDDTYSRGSAGLAGVLAGEGAIHVTFDEVNVWDGSLLAP